MIKTGPVNIFIMEYTASGFRLTSTIDTYEELEFTRSFFNIGSFSFSMLADSPQAQFLKADAFIIVSDSFGEASDRVGIIQTVDRHIEDGSKKLIKVEGLEAKSMLSYRMIDPGTTNARYTSTGTFESAVKAMVNSQCGSTVTDANRVFPGFTVAASAARGPTYTFNERWSNLSEAIQKGCISAEVGYKVYWSGSELVFDTIHGIDRTLGNGVHNPAVFSTDFDTVKTSHFMLSKANYKNYSYTGGQGVGVARTIQPAYSTPNVPTGYGRREIFTDARDLSATADLTVRGAQALDEYQYGSFVEATLNSFATFSQASGVDLGDLATVQSFGYEQVSRITGMSEQWGKAGYDCSLAMDRQLPTAQSIANAEAYKASKANTFAEGTIIETGSGSNGYYEKYSGGLVKMYHTMASSSNGPAGGAKPLTYYQSGTWTYPYSLPAGKVALFVSATPLYTVTNANACPGYAANLTNTNHFWVTYSDSTGNKNVLLFAVAPWR